MRKDPQAGRIFGREPLGQESPTTPVNTSPMPPVAMPGFPVVLIQLRPEGLATTVFAPFSTTTVRLVSASFVATPMRSAATMEVVVPASRPFRRGGA